MKKKLINIERDLSTNKNGLMSCTDDKKNDLIALGERFWPSVGGGLFGIDIFCGTTNNGCDKNAVCDTTGG